MLRYFFPLLRIPVHVAETISVRELNDRSFATFLFFVQLLALLKDTVGRLTKKELRLLFESDTNEELNPEF